MKYVDPDGNRILVASTYYNMSTYSSVNLGNSSKVKVSQQGCYITSFANILRSAATVYEKTFTKNDYSSPMKINNDKSLFAKDSACLNGRSASMNAIFGEDNWDYWTAQGQGGADKLLDKLKEYSNDIDGYMIVGIFDLSNATKDVDNHMVIINGLPNENGVFDSIGATSNGDINRLNDEKKASEYNINNLKEFRVIKVTDFYNCTPGE